MTGELACRTTVVIPVWDRYVVGLLEEAIESLRAQDLTAPIVVIDNASTIPLPRLDGVEVVRAPDRVTLGAARNLGLEQVSTPYVVFWDADDIMLAGTLGFLEQTIESEPSLVAFGAGIVDGSTGGRHRWPRPWMTALARVPAVFALVDCVWSLFPSTGATIMRTQLVRDAGGYCDAVSGQDWCLGVSLAFRGRVGWSERPGRIYRIHDQSVWARHMSARHQVDHARNVRGRIRGDRGIPSWARRALPLIAVAQHAAIAAHLVVAALRRVRS
jgi:glycosyltransferase involved in cell wall biosynthesis